MANDINRTVLVGRLVREPELRSTTNGSYLCRFTLASNHTQFVKDGDNIEHVGFFDCVTFGKLAEVISKYAQKGKRVGVDGALRFSSWENAEGKKQSRVEIFVENFQFLDAKTQGEAEQSEPPAADNYPEPGTDSIPF